MKRIAMLIALLQAFLAFRVIARLVSTAGGTRIKRRPEVDNVEGSVTVLVPVLNEAGRLPECLAGVTTQGAEVAEILVVDGGSTDGTQAIVASFTARDERVRLIDASPVPNDVNGKAHGLQAGLDAASPRTDWLLTLDADVRPDPMLARSLLGHAAQEGIELLSVATLQRLSGAAEGVLHPAMLATLVYRFGIPGSATAEVDQVQANGQCFLIKRDVLTRAGGFVGVLGSVCEDVTLARAVAATGRRVGFYEAGDLVSVAMYEGWRDAWDNWS
ncbi:MAG TPA: glycosyltransferase family 2 protein, partial [Thermomicrobiales bacterium]|nr:glycosyltransferase family 2 protein [Thermomicrobiales bacterium]